MKYVLTASEIMDRRVWDTFCELRGINVWAVNEGLMDSDEEFTLTEDEAAALGITDREGTG